MSYKEIKQLSSSLTNLISAGEVVERPSSVVKELVENSIDANSTKIRIELVNSGLKSIIVYDNGIGIKKNDIPIALLNHATSKIQTIDDLFNITSLGFRGEALPSIASISKFTITSSIDGISGHKYYYEGGSKIYDCEAKSNKGTTIEVVDLFYNTPARLKHLGSESTELSHISTLVNRIALANPSISFTLINNDRTIYQTNGDNDMISLISKTYGLDVGKHTIYFEGSNDLYKVYGYTSTNNVFRSSKNAINIIINKRIIRNINIVYAITDAYKTIIPINKYPVTTLIIECNPNCIDVNVHPSKIEIRFTDELKLRSFITYLITKSLNEVSLIYESSSNDLINNKDTNSNLSSTNDLESKELNINTLWNNFPNNTKVNQDSEEFIEEDLIYKDENLITNLMKNEPSEPHEPLSPISHNYSSIEEDEAIDLSMAFDYKSDESFESLKEDKISLYNDEHHFVDYRYIGQYNETYLLFEYDSELILIDQHAAAERYNYELILESFKSKDQSIFELLIPLSLSYDTGEVIRIMEKKEELKSLGFNILLQSDNTIDVLSVPTWIKKDFISEITRDVINHIINDSKATVDIMYDSLAKSIACKKSLKGNTKVLNVEVRALLENLDKCKMPYTCPHGRPTIVKISLYDIEKLFKRVI